jgi:hypothetical protein
MAPLTCWANQTATVHAGAPPTAHSHCPVSYEWDANSLIWMRSACLTSVRRRSYGRAEARAPDRYFYFEAVRDHDSLFRHVVRAILAIEPSRS